MARTNGLTHNKILREAPTRCSPPSLWTHDQSEAALLVRRPTCATRTTAASNRRLMPIVVGSCQLLGRCSVLLPQCAYTTSAATACKDECKGSWCYGYQDFSGCIRPAEIMMVNLPSQSWPTAVPGYSGSRYLYSYRTLSLLGRLLRAIARMGPAALTRDAGKLERKPCRRVWLCTT